LKIVAEDYLRREAGNLRTIEARRAVFGRHIFSRFGSRPIDSIKRSEILRLFDAVSEDSGPAAAVHVLAALRRLMNWHASRSDDFRSPIVRGMIRWGSKARQRVLSDHELRIVWCVAAEHQGPFDFMVQ